MLFGYLNYFIVSKKIKAEVIEGICECVEVLKNKNTKFPSGGAHCTFLFSFYVLPVHVT